MKVTEAHFQYYPCFPIDEPMLWIWRQNIEYLKSYCVNEVPNN